MSDPVYQEGWGWVCGESHELQPELFSTPNEAIGEMKQRLGGKEITMERIEGAGFRLARIRATYRLVALMEPVR